MTGNKQIIGRLNY